MRFNETRKVSNSEDGRMAMTNQDVASIPDPLPAILAARARTQPDRIFIRTVEGEDVSYADLERRVRAWMETLIEAGTEAGKNIVVMLPNSIDSIAIWMAVARIGAVEVPINTAYLGSMLRHVVVDSSADIVIAHTRFLPRFEALQDEMPNVRELIAVGEGGEAGISRFRVSAPHRAAGGSERRSVKLEAHDLACIVYTSGTTGPSKGVMVPWRQICETARWCIPNKDLTPEDVWYCPWPFYHVSGKLSLYGTALAGATLVLRDTFSTSQFWPDIRNFGCTTTMVVGATIAFLESQPPTPRDRDHPLRNVYVCPLPQDPQSFMARFGVRLCTAFNMTETSCPIVTEWVLGPGNSCGRVRPGAACRIVDEHDEEVPDGTVGELVVRSDRSWELMSGYWNRAEATVSTWRNQWFHTGDAFKRDAEGNYFFVDRLKYSIRRRGENLSSVELESEVNAHPDVAESAAIGVPSEWGEEDIKVFVVTKNGRELDPADLIRFLTPRVPRFMLPRYIVQVDGIPKTDTFRARKEELKAMPVNEKTWDSARQ
ncbi:AMP-binding protein [Pseudochelatococcus sp. B33]